MITKFKAHETVPAWIICAPHPSVQHLAYFGVSAVVFHSYDRVGPVIVMPEEPLRKGAAVIRLKTNDVSGWEGAPTMVETRSFVELYGETINER